MSYRVLILHAEPAQAQLIADHFSGTNREVWQAYNSGKALLLLAEHQPEVVFLDLHLPGDSWQNVLASIRRDYPQVQVIATTSFPDLRTEMLAREQGVRSFLREPFAPEYIQRAIQRLTQETPEPVLSHSVRNLPPVRIPIRLKITFPFALLALFFAGAAAYLGGRFIMDSIQDRFMRQLVDVGTLSADWMVQKENRMLESLRFISFTEGLPDALAARESERLKEIALPIAVNNREEAIEILDLNGVSMLSLRHRLEGGLEDYEFSSGAVELGSLDFVQNVLQGKKDAYGDKFSGLAQMPWGDYFYIAGPLMDDNNQLAGVILVGSSLESMARDIRQDTLAQVTFYTTSGDIIQSTMLKGLDVQPIDDATAQTILANQARQTLVRDLAVASAKYSELLRPWESRGDTDMGLIGVALHQNFQVYTTLFTRFQAFFFVAIAFIGVIVLGIYLANQVTNPLSQVVKASSQVAQGDLEVTVPANGNDEVAVLAHAFNFMVSGLQEGFIYRDLLGRTVSPEVREALRQSFASGDLKLEGHNTVGTVLVSDIRGFTTLAEKEEPTTVLTWLNEYFREIVPVVTSNGGVVDKFEGDSLLAFFGILPTPLPGEESARMACRAAAEMLEVIERINLRRELRGEPPFETGIGVNTGVLTAGGLGTSDRMNYTIIGNTVNTSARIQGVSREFGESGIVVSAQTFKHLGEERDRFNWEFLGLYDLRGKQETIGLYRMHPVLVPDPILEMVA